jgi:hypothetical protein
MSMIVTFNAGLMNTFRLTEQLRLLLNLRGALIGDAFDGESYLAVAHQGSLAC